MAVQIRAIWPSDYRLVISVIDGWWAADTWRTQVGRGASGAQAGGAPDRARPVLPPRQDRPLDGSRSSAVHV